MTFRTAIARLVSFFAVALSVASGNIAAAAAQSPSLLVNGSFEQRDSANPARAAGWTDSTAPGDLPLEPGAEHYEGVACAALIGDGKSRAWRQTVASPALRNFALRGMVKADSADMGGREDYAMLYGHILYKGQPYETATHFYAKLDAGSYDWKPFAATALAKPGYEVEKVYVTVAGRLTSGRILIDQVELTEDAENSPATLLRAKVDDLSKHLERVGDVDDSTEKSKAQLAEAVAALNGTAGPDVPSATRAWTAAAEALSPRAWEAMYPGAVRGAPKSEARMIYHGLGRTRQECDRNLDILHRANVNAVYLSLGSWMGVTYPSKLVPTEPDWASASDGGRFDALAYFIDGAHKRDIKVFAYFAALYGTFDRIENADDPRSIAKLHPDWLAKPPPDGSGFPRQPTFPDPGNPDVADYVARVYAELVTRYPLDGVGLDYIRYPSPTALGFDELNRERLLKDTNLDLRSPGSLLERENWEKVKLYRAANTRRIIEGVRKAVREVRPGLPIIACLISDPDEGLEYAQRWGASSVLLDYGSPMNYNDVSADIPLLEKQRDTFAKNHVRFIPAVGGMPDVHERWTLSRWAERIALQRKVGCDGIIIYRFADLDPAFVAFLGSGPFHGKATFPAPLEKKDSAP